MNWHEFVFSKSSPQRYIRHIVFWLFWGLYFSISMNYLPRQTNAAPRIDYSLTNFPGLVHLLLTLCIHIVGCYTLINGILPRFILKSRYVLAFISTILLVFVMVQTARLVDSRIMPFLFHSSGNSSIPYYASIFSGVVSAVKMMAVAVGIKLIKHWSFKQKEKEKLEKEKIEAELQLLKTQIHPGFLFNALKNIYVFAITASPKAPEMLLKLSDILSYMLYECNDPEVNLEKEIKMLKDYMTLEKTPYGDKMEMNVQVRGDISQEKIAPLLLLRFVENSFKQCSQNNTEQPWINFEIQVEKHVLFVKLMNGKPPIKIPSEDGEDDDIVQVQKRLELLYPGQHKLRIMEEPEIMMVTLEICLPQRTVHHAIGEGELSGVQSRDLIYAK